jgi:hypothetical protein
MSVVEHVCVQHAEEEVEGRVGSIASFWRFTSAIIVDNTDVDGHAQMLLKLYNYLQ